MTDNAWQNAPFVTASEFFSRAQERLSFDVPAGLADTHVIPQYDEQDADPWNIDVKFAVVALDWFRAGLQNDH
jgi:hypothetical protein